MLYKTINGNTATTHLVSQQSYNQLGQMKQKQLGQLSDNSFLETQDYSYNIRGWLKGINKDYSNNDNTHGGNSRWFGMELSYDWGFAANQLNGNIGGEKWRSKGDGQQRSYGFGYDPLNRLLYADFNQYTGSTWNKTAGIDYSSMMGNGTDPNTAYDENGNIKAMWQKGWQLSGSNPIDSLNYTYYTNSNKLQNVIDGRNDPLTALGDFRTSSLSPYNTGKTTSAVDYSYDANGNLTRDLNKDIGSQTADGIIYNHLNLPWQVTVRSATGTKGYIRYIYDATGNKLKKTTVDTAGNIITVATYIGVFQYQSRQPLSGTTPADTLQFFGQEEGRVRVLQDTTGGQPVPSFKYDYFLKDHLGNTRMVLTDEQQTDMYPAATMETGDSATENLYYSKLDNTRTALPSGYPTDTTTNPNNYVIKVSGVTGGNKIGSGITLKVMAGDQFSIKASSWYKANGASPGVPANPLSDLLSALIGGVGGIAGGHLTTTQLQTNSTLISPNITQFLADTGTRITETKPHAFVNWVLFDNQMNYVSASSGFDQVGNNQEFKKHVLTNLPVTKSGYLYIYLSNETPNIDVFFDNLQLTHIRGPLLEENHYYPFGLIMQGISDKALKVNYFLNQNKFNGGNELQNREFSDGSGLEMYDATFRGYDPQLARFWQIDPLADYNEDVSPYLFANNNPITFNDPLGLLSDSSHPQVLATAYKSGGKKKSDLSSINVGKAAGPAPIRAPRILKEELTHEIQIAKIGLLGYDPNDPMEKLKHTIVVKPTFWGRFINDVGYQGKNIFGEKVFIPYYGGTAPDVMLAEEAEVAGAYTIFERISKRIRLRSTLIFKVGINSVTFESALAKAAGRAWQISADGKIKILLYNGIKYVSRAFSSSGEATMEIWKDGQLLQKYRLL